MVLMLATIGRTLFWIFCLVMVGIAVRFVWLSWDGVADGVRHQIHHITQRAPVLFVHAGISILAMVLLPFQLWRGLRTSYRTIHRATGIIYVGSVLVGGIAGVVLGLNADMTAFGSTGFVLGAIIWVSTTAVGAFFAAQGNQLKHRQWMLVSAAMTFAAVSIRIEFPLFRHVFGMGYDPAYELSAWTCWAVNLLLLYLWHLRAPANALPGLRFVQRAR